jgi:hypothetical protein
MQPKQRAVSEVDAEIAKVEGEIAAIIPKAEQAMQSFANVTGEYVKAWLPDKIQAYAVAMSDATKKLGDRLKELKAEVSTLAEAMPTRVPAWLNEDGYWRHRSGFEAAQEKKFWNADYHHHGIEDRGPGPIGQRLQEEINDTVKELLGRYGYTSIGQQTHAFELSWRGTLQDALKPYVELMRQMKNAEDRLRALRGERSQSEAREMWDKA